MRGSTCREFFLLPAVLLWPLSAGAQTPDGYEPDGHPLFAKPHAGCGTPESITSSFHTADDEDWVGFYHNGVQMILRIDPASSVDLSDDDTGTGLHVEVYRRRADGRGDFVETLVDQVNDALVDLRLNGEDGYQADFYFLRIRGCREAGNPACATASFPSAGAEYCAFVDASSGSSDAGLLRSRAVDADTGAGIPFALVVTSGNAGTFTDVDGNFEISDVAGTYTGTVFHELYDDAPIPEFTLIAMETTTLPLPRGEGIELTPSGRIFADGYE